MHVEALSQYQNSLLRSNKLVVETRTYDLQIIAPFDHPEQLPYSYTYISMHRLNSLFLNQVDSVSLDNLLWCLFSV